MSHECKKEEVINIIRDDVKDIKQDVKTLLTSKNKMDGGLIVIMFIISSAVAFVAKLL